MAGASRRSCAVASRGPVGRAVRSRPPERGPLRAQAPTVSARLGARRFRAAGGRLWNSGCSTCATTPKPARWS